ncbi:pre-mRNA-processing factor 39-like [Pollicipes pollicipes]|uniref:pre-mRNA-processing factor 39-like n=1 Tax=Pollicipes pollicipes TaxID=41117 RepID=UPI001884AED5|nr:pre-mRNA-processing factor 39-like [Pollicipes pollicipes]
MLEHYWQFVRENPYDFNGWTYLLQHVEKQTNLDAIRGVYNAFLPLYPYCYAYWKKYADLEQRSGYTERSLQILERAVKAIPLSIELWMALLNQFRDSVKGQKTAEEQTRAICERAVRCAGAQFRSDALWECFIQWESTHGAMSNVTAIYRRLLKIPTRLYNRHWDDFLQHVRDHHPRDILEREEYVALRRACCLELGVTYREESASPLADPAKIRQPEVKLVSAIKEKLVASLVAIHEKTEKKAEKRWKLEEKIKRPYFHVIALDRRQLRAWRDYLELEAADGDHDSLVMLYERCLIACAQYEEFWLQYARYLERRLQSVPSPSAADDAAMRRLLEADRAGGGGAQYETESRRLPEERSHVAAGYAARANPADAVREVYKRACLVHCPTRPNIRLQWAAFEESIGERAAAGAARADHGRCRRTAPVPVGSRAAVFRRNTIALRANQSRLTSKCTNAAERRRGRPDECSRLYQAAADAAPAHLATWWAMKHARFCFKILNKPDKALGILRTAVKRDRSNPRLYLHILDVCYQRHPVDVRGVTAALTLALNSKDVSARDKLGFRRKKVEFFEEFGSLRQLREAEDELETAERVLAATERKQARQQGQDAQEQEPEQEDAGGAAGRPVAKRRRKVEMEPTPPPPLPNGAVTPPAAASGAAQCCPKCGWDGSEPQTPAGQRPPAPAALQPSSYGQVPPTWDLTMKTDACGYGKDPQYKWFQEQGYRDYDAREAGGYPTTLLDPVSSDEEALSGPPPPPPAKRPRPDDGQTPHIVTKDGRRVPRYVIPPQAPPLRPLMQPLVLQPTEAPGRQEPRRPPQLARLRPPPPPPPPAQETGASCVNVPEWLVREGGELCLSETDGGVSLIRYWPRFMNDCGVQRMFHTLRRYVKWHQTRQVAPDGRFVALKRLVAWFGPCSLEESGLMMPANDSWAPELLDLLQRLMQLTGQEFNSCHLSLFRSGHDHEPWHTHDQPTLGRQPAIAIVSLGAVRNFELRQKSGGGTRFLRFPLFPGSVLLMEGNTQEDWVHQVPKDPLAKEERISLQFRVMYDPMDIQAQNRPRL